MIRVLILFALSPRCAAVVAVLFVSYADLLDPSLRCVPGTLDRLAARLPGQVSTPGDDGYPAATAIWSKPAGRMSDAVVHCQTPLGPLDTGDAPHFDPAGRAIRARGDEVVGVAAQYDVRFV